MKRNNKIILTVLISGILLIPCYYFISILFGRKNTYSDKYYFYQNWSDWAPTKKIALEKKIYLVEPKLNIDTIKNDNLNENDIDFWLSKRIIHNQYGILPLFHFIDTVSDYCSFNLNKKKENELIFQINKVKDYHTHKYYDLDDGPAYSIIDNASFPAKLPHDTLILEFYMKEKNGSPEFFSIGSIKFTW